MKNTSLRYSALVILTAFAGFANAAEYNYVFEQNITKFLNERPASYELLSTPYASMAVKDTDFGVQIDVNINKEYSGWLHQISFDHIPQLSNFTQHYTHLFQQPVPDAGTAYYSSDIDSVSYYTTGHSLPNFAPITSIFTLEASNPFGEKFSIYFHNLPTGIDAAIFSPAYLNVAQANGWAKIAGNQAAVLATAAVPEPSTLVLTFIGVLALIFAVRQKRSA